MKKTAYQWRLSLPKWIRPKYVRMIAGRMHIRYEDIDDALTGYCGEYCGDHRDSNNRSVECDCNRTFAPDDEHGWENTDEGYEFWDRVFMLSYYLSGEAGNLSSHELQLRDGESFDNYFDRIEIYKYES